MDSNRRTFLLGAGVLILTALSASAKGFSFSKLFYDSVTGGKVAVEANFTVFYKLSQWLTYREKLSEKAAKKLYKAFQNEPWGKEHIIQVYNKLQNSIENQDTSLDIQSLIEADYFSDGERWFILHLITTWYLGIYYHEDMLNQRVLYEEALMFSSLEGLATIPYYNATPYGDWSNPPEQEKS